MKNLKEILNKKFKKMTRANAEAIQRRYLDSTATRLSDVYSVFSNRKVNGWDYCINKSDKLIDELRQNCKEVIDWALCITGFNSCFFSCAKIIYIKDLKVSILLYYTHCHDYFFIFEE